MSETYDPTTWPTSSAIPFGLYGKTEAVDIGRSLAVGEAVTAEQLHVIRSRVLHEVVRELDALRTRLNGDGTPVFSDSGQHVVGVLSAYVEAWARKPDIAPSWEPTEGAQL